MAMDLKEQIAQLERQLQEERLRTGDAAMDVQHLTEQLSEQQPRYQAVYVAPTRKLERFRGRPATPAEPTIEEWAEDVRMQLATRKLELAAQAAFVMDHLSGNAIAETCRDVRPHLPNRPNLCAVSGGDAKGASG